MKKTSKDPFSSFTSLPNEIVDELRKNMQKTSYSQGESIFWQDDSPEYIYLMIAGHIKIVRFTSDGYESILCVRNSGEYFCPVPLLDKGPQLGTAYAMSNVSLYKIKKDFFLSLCKRSPELLSIVQSDCLSEVRNLLNRFEGVAYRSVPARLANFLISESRIASVNNEHFYEIQMTQNEIAALIGSTRESVSRNLSKMQQEGLIKVKRGRIILLDRTKLRKLGQTK